MARNFFATEVVDFVCNDCSNGENEREGVQNIHSYRKGTTVGLACLLKLSFHCQLRKLQVFNLRATIEPSK